MTRQKSLGATKRQGEKRPYEDDLQGEEVIGIGIVFGDKKLTRYRFLARASCIVIICSWRVSFPSLNDDDDSNGDYDGFL